MSDIIPDIRILIETRKYIFSHVNELSESQLLHIPEKFKTNILWNIGHLVATQQILHYFLSGLPPLMKEDSIKIFRKGSKPPVDSGVLDVQEVFDSFIEFPQVLADDYGNSRFSSFRAYKTSVGVTLNNIEDAISFNNYHEGVHAGIIQSIMKFI